MTKMCPALLCSALFAFACNGPSPAPESQTKRQAIEGPIGECDPNFDFDCQPDCTLDPWDPACAPPGGGAPPDPGQTPQQIATNLLGGLGRDGILWWWSTNDYQAFQLTAAGDVAEIAGGICAVQPELCVVVGVGLGVYTIYVNWDHLQALADALRRAFTAREAAPVTYAPYYPGSQADGKCIPPDPAKYVKWRGSDDSHWHYIDWNQQPPPSCWAFPVFKTGPDPGPAWREIPR